MNSHLFGQNLILIRFWLPQVFYFFSFLTNILATSQQLYATVLFIHYLTGISVYGMF